MSFKILYRYILFMTLSIMTGCHLQPIYKYPTSNAPQKQAGMIDIQIKGNTQDADLHYKLKKEIDVWLPTLSNTENSFKVLIEFHTSFADIALTAKGKTLRSQGNMQAKLFIFEASQIKDLNKPLFQKKLEAITSFTVEDFEEFSIISGESGANERMIKTLAQDIVYELSVFLSTL